ncbi:MAG: thermostable hemolysin [Burkholderiales bacterium]|nr:thermostable hemolysin [Burkholderiales bacterium]
MHPALLESGARQQGESPMKVSEQAYRKRFHVNFSGPEAEDRQELEHFIYKSFKLAYGAHVHHFMPQLMSLRDVKGELLAVCGLRSAGAEKLFLEDYFDEPVDAVLRVRAGRKVMREDIVEVGNLAAFRPGMGRHLIAVLTAHLHEIGVHWVVFTANPGLRNAFTKLGIELTPICEADRTRLPAECQAGWGSYYGKNPHVMAGNVPENYPILLENLRLLEPLP